MFESPIASPPPYPSPPLFLWRQVATSSQCAAALEHLAAYRFREMADAVDDDDDDDDEGGMREGGDGLGGSGGGGGGGGMGGGGGGGGGGGRRKPLSKLHEEHDLFAMQLGTLLHMIVFEECTNQWSLSRPLLALILICEDAYAAWKEQALHSMASHPQRQQTLALAFDKLMRDVPRGREANLDVKTRDRFTQNLSQFRHEVRTLV